MRLGVAPAVGASRATGLSASTKSLVNDALEGTRAPATFSAAAEAAIELLGIAGQIFRGADSIADIVVAKDVAGTNNHEKRAGLSVMRRDRYSRWWLDAKRKSLFSSDSKLIGMQTGMNLKTFLALDQNPLRCAHS
jgi:hypothetical protein